jgi:hypothetical protein
MIQKHGVDTYYKTDAYKNKEGKRTSKILTELIALYGEDYMKDKKEYSYHKLVYEKIKYNNLKKHGVEHVFQLPSCKENITKTVIKKYGVTNVSYNPKILEKIKTNLTASNMENYGVPYPLMDKTIRAKAMESIKEKYGVDNVMTLPETKEKIIKKMQEKFHVDNAMQAADLVDKSIKHAKKSKTYKLPSGIEIKIQGYENYALDDLLKYIAEDDIIVAKSQMPEIWYMCDDGKYKRYFPDIYVKSTNTFYEVKSMFTYMKDFRVNDCKRKATEYIGYNFKLMIYDRNGRLMN